MKILTCLIEPLENLQKIIGMHIVKNQIVDQILSSLQELYDETQHFHTMIQGPPGVGKTMLGKLLGEIYLRMGILKSNKVKFTIAKRSDLVGKFLGHTAKQTQAFIDSCEGGVLFIDEIYSLGNAEKRDSYSKECIDTLNINLTEKKNFVCIVAGYVKEIEECFFSYNPGLKRRFQFIYEINEYSNIELQQILRLKVNAFNWNLHDNIDDQWLNDFFKTNKNHFVHFGGDIDTFLLNCKTVHGKRVFGKDPGLRKILTKDDINNGLNKFLESKELKDNDELVNNFMYI